MKIISLWRPWGLAIILGLKGIETRQHARFRCLVGHRIGIHNTVKWDAGAMDLMDRYIPKDPLHPSRVSFFERFRAWDKTAHLPGAIIGTVYVEEFRDNLYGPLDETRALCPITTNKYGLVVNRPRRFKRPIITPGAMGIWNYDLLEGA